MSAIKELFTKVKASLSSLLKYTPSKAPTSDFHTPSQEIESVLPLPEDQPPNTGYDTASFYMAKKDSKFYNTTSNYPTTQLKYETTDKKLTRSEYKNLNDNNFSFLKKRKINSVLKMVQYITNDKFNNNCDESLNVSENVSMRTNNSAFKNIGGFRGGILNEKRKILNFNDFSNNSMLMKKNPLNPINPSSSSKIHDDSISMNSYYSSNSFTKKMINKSLILSRKSLNDLSLEIQKKKKDNEEKIKKISESSLMKKANTEYEERKKILENYYKKKESQQKNVSIYNFFNNNDNSCFDNLHFIHNEKIMLKGIEKPKESLKINKNNQITISGTETKKDNYSVEKKKDNLFTFKNLENKNEEKKESIFLYGKKEEKEIKEPPSTSLFGNNINKDNSKPLFGVDNKNVEDKTEKKNIFGFSPSPQETKGSLFGKVNNEQEKKPSLFGGLAKEPKENKGLFGFISPNEPKKEEKKEIEPKKEEKKGSIFDNTPKPIFMVPKEKTVELKTTPFSESILKNPVFGVPKEKTNLFEKQKEPEIKTNSLFGSQLQKEDKPKGSLFGNIVDEKPTNSLFSNLINKPKEENKDNKKETPLFGSNKTDKDNKKETSLFGSETINKANNLFGNTTSNETKKEAVKPLFQLNKVNDEKKDKQKETNSIFNPTNEKKTEEKKNSLFGVANSSGSLVNSSNPFISVMKTETKINNLFSVSSTLSTQPTTQTDQPKPQNLSLFGNSLSANTNLFGSVQNPPSSTNQTNNQDEMQLSPIGSPRKLENPSTMNIFGNTTQGMNEQKSLFTQNTNSIFNSNISSTQSLFGNNTLNTTTNNTLFPQIQNQTSLGVQQTPLFSSNFSIGKPTFSMGKKK